jgi:hypothetical protein
MTTVLYDIASVIHFRRHMCVTFNLDAHITCCSIYHFKIGCDMLLPPLACLLQAMNGRAEASREDLTGW